MARRSRYFDIIEEVSEDKVIETTIEETVDTVGTVEEETDTVSPTDELNELIVRYAASKDQEKTVTTAVKAQNSRIKELLEELGMDAFDAGVASVSLTETVKQSFDESTLINIIKGLVLPVALERKIIKKKEYVDMEELENAINKKKIEAADLASAQNVSISKTLRVKWKKA